MQKEELSIMNMKNNKWKIYLGLVVILAISIILITNIRKKETTNEVTTEINPVYGNIQTSISTTGIVQPQNRLEIMPTISGRIERILVKEGDKVKTGQILAWMSSTERAALLDTARSQSEETLKYWQEVYKPAPLTAPISGEVIVKAVEPGQTVTSATPVLVLADRLIVKAQVDETDIGMVKVGQNAIITLDAYPEVKVKGEVDHIAYESKIINNVTIYEVDILPEEVPPVFRSGMSANVDIIEEGKENVLLIPLEAVKEDKEGSFVFLGKGKAKKYTKHRIELGVSDEKNVEITSGLEVKDKIIIKTQKYLPSKNQGPGGSPFMPFRRRKR